MTTEPEMQLRYVLFRYNEGGAWVLALVPVAPTSSPDASAEGAPELENATVNEASTIG
jgi:hypothetical protein